MAAARASGVLPSTSASAPPKLSECTAPGRCGVREPLPARPTSGRAYSQTKSQRRRVRSHGVLVNGPAADKAGDSLIFRGESSTAAPVGANVEKMSILILVAAMSEGFA